MANDSSTGGYLVPSGTPPLDDQALDRFFHDVFMGITGMAANMIRPRWQQEPGNMPPPGTDWMAQGSVEREDEGVAWQYFAKGTQTFTLARNQSIMNLVSVYGPNASANEGLLRDGLSLDQNREAMNLQGIRLVRVGDPRNMSMLINEQWAKRIDVRIVFRRQIIRTYPVLSIQSGSVQIETDTGVVETVTIT